MMRGNYATHSPYGIDVPGHEANTGPSRHSAILRLSDIPRRGLRRGLRHGTLRISDFCFLMATLSALVGMGLGIFMGIAQDFTLAPAHAHLNLLGWVTIAIYGLYHRSIGRMGGVAGWLQVGSGALGAVLMTLGLAVYLSTGSDNAFPMVVAGSLLVALSMLLFLGIVITDLMRVRPPSAADAPFV
jgi:hypothetical protein